MFTAVSSMGLIGMGGYEVRVEADVFNALPAFDIVGLPDSAIKEAKDRVLTAIKNCGYAVPLGKIVVNLAPADTKKSGPVYDLAIILAVLSAGRQVSLPDKRYAYIGELSLSGEIKGVTGVLPMILAARDLGFEGVFISEENRNEALIADKIDIYPVRHVDELCGFFAGRKALEPVKEAAAFEYHATFGEDFSDVKGQFQAKRAMEIAAAGAHNILLIGPPGAGKSMLAKRLPSILPPMTFEEAVESTKIHSVGGTLQSSGTLISNRPFRAPHYTVSASSLAGGGTIPRPGEISLAHNGVLFLDELPEFSRDAKEILRQPMEDGYVSISRVGGKATFPSRFMLVAAMNPCPCGYFGHPAKNCTCSRQAVSGYLAKVSGPLLDRIDLHVEVAPVAYEHMASSKKDEGSSAIRERVMKARELQSERYKGYDFSYNSTIAPGVLREFCQTEPAAEALIKKAFDSIGLSARAYDRILKVSRTIADLAGSEIILLPHVAEAIQYRALDGKYWR